MVSEQPYFLTPAGIEESSETIQMKAPLSSDARKLELIKIIWSNKLFRNLDVLLALYKSRRYKRGGRYVFLETQTQTVHSFDVNTRATMLLQSLLSLSFATFLVRANNGGSDDFYNSNSLERTRVNGLNDTTLAKVRTRMLELVHYSWELGTASEALLELEESDLSVYGDKPFPPSRTLSADSPIISIAEYVLSIKPPGTLPLMEDGAAGDPASVGVAVLLANQTFANASYALAASQEIQFLLEVVPRAPNGAISHRVSEAQLWDDFVYMGPPYLAYYGALFHNITLLQEAKRQIGLYREVLRDPQTSLWHHVLLGSWSDPALWGTGMAWVAAGSTRVLQTMLKSPFAVQLQGDMWEISGWVGELLGAAWGYQKRQGEFRGGLYNLPTENDFPDSAWTALLAAATYRLAVQTGNKQWIPNANKAFAYIQRQIASDGTLLNVTDVFQWKQAGINSPEGQAFVLLLQAAHRDYTKWEECHA
ncbi:hypothetical protein FRC14_000469, partial [Serendipita sp. 396]